MADAILNPAHDGSILVSVIVPTFNRADLVRELVDSLNGQTLEPSRYEVLVMDNCSADNTAEMIGQLQRQVQFRLVYHRLAQNGGPVQSRNMGSRMARGAVLAFTDSDCRVSSDWLEHGLKALELHPDAAFVTGPVQDKPEQNAGFFSLRYDAPPGEDQTYRACNVFYRAQIFWQTGGFDEGAYYGQTRFMHYECADMDLAWRVKEEGYANVYATDVIVYHEVWTVSPWKWLHKQTQLMPLPLFLKRHPQLASSFLWHEPLYAPQNALFYVLVAGLILAWMRVWFLVLTLPYLVWLVRRVTLKLWNRPVRMLAALTFWGLAQAVMCGSLLWGSIRARRIVL